MKFKAIVIGAMLGAAWAPCAIAAVSADEAKALGTTLTPLGGEKAGNKDGSIPAWSGGLKTPPACYKKSESRLCDPYAGEKPIYTIDAKNMGKYEDRLSEGQKALLKKYPSYQLQVYPSHRSAAQPQWTYDNAAKNAIRASTTDGGVGITGAHGGTPFPIPKDGFEVMWNHLTRYSGQSRTVTSDTYNVDATGSTHLAVRTKAVEDYPYYDTRVNSAELYWRVRHNYVAPVRQAGWGLILLDPLNAAAKGRRAWQYLPGQRRVKLAPDLAFDTPATQNAGACFYDDVYLFNGSMERYDFKLIGKKEMYVPYNTYKYTATTPAADLFQPNHLNPGVLRWELHRVWVVEGTLKANARHAYAKRRFYVDEDTWYALLSESYDARGQLWRTAMHGMSQNYDALVPSTGNHVTYDLLSGMYTHAGTTNDHKVEYGAPLPNSTFSADALAGAGIR